MVVQYLNYKIDEISSITTEDYIKLKGTLYDLANRDFICSECVTKFKGRTDEKEMLRKTKTTRNCETVSTPSMLFQVYDLKSKRCPGNLFSREVVFHYELFQKFKLGILPFQGSLSDQPNKIIEIFKIIEEWEIDRQKKEIEANGRRNLSKNHSGNRRGNKSIS
jgi:hypothetical protein